VSKVIEDLNELIELAKRDEGLDCFMCLNGGLRSSKHITYQNGKFDVLNEIDDSWQEDLTEADLWDQTNIGEALDKRALYLY